jgi:hypothetical protein
MANIWCWLTSQTTECQFGKCTVTQSAASPHLSIRNKIFVERQRMLNILAIAPLNGSAILSQQRSGNFWRVRQT